MEQAEKPGAVETGQAWCQVRQTVLMLELAAAQIHAAMRDSNLSVAVLSESFTAMAASMHGLQARLRDSGPPELEARVDEAGAAMDQALIAMQFYDRLAQRLEHVEHGLGHLAQLLSDPARIAAPPAWQALQAEIQSRYTTEEERTMFAAVMGGMSVAEAIQHYLETMHAKPRLDSDVELF